MFFRCTEIVGDPGSGDRGLALSDAGRVRADAVSALGGNDVTERWGGETAERNGGDTPEVWVRDGRVWGES